jgi:hypothetical protein
MKPFNKEAILLLIANPVDILAYFALQYSGLPATQVIGSGTFLDSARLRGALAAKASVAASSIDAFVIGEHGESQVVSSIDPVCPVSRYHIGTNAQNLTSNKGRLVQRLCGWHPTPSISRDQITRPRGHRYRDTPEGFCTD